MAKQSTQTIIHLPPPMIRQPAVSGAFYSADKFILQKQIDNFLAETQKLMPQSPRILIVPHAGYQYSGLVAAWGYKQLENSDITRVFLLGVSHNSFFSKAAIYNEGEWLTSLGKINIDSQMAADLIKQSNYLEVNQTVHEQEHSLEVQLPFLQTVLANFKIVPILLSQTSQALLISLAKAISKYLDNKSILVISSDLSHYPDYDTAKRIDKLTYNAILSGNVDKFNDTINQGQKLAVVDTCACGAEAIKVGMEVAETQKLKTIKLINYSNSGDISGDYSRVVGYASIGFYK